jgi:hypothetical protein
MNESAVGRVAMLLVLIAAVVGPMFNVVLHGAPGAAVFAVADLPWAALLPMFREDYLPGISISFGLFWPLLLAGLIIVAFNRTLPERRRGVAALGYRCVWLAVSATVMSAALALPFHLYGLWMTHREYGTWSALLSLTA